MTEEEIVPLTINQLLLGRSTNAARSTYTKSAQENYMAANDYQEELLAQWWKRWQVIGLPQMIPYQSLKDAKRHKNLQVGDVCLLQYDGKIKHTYRLCIILPTIPSDDAIVRTVTLGFRARRQCRPGPYKPVALDELVVGVPRLVFILPAEELPQPLVSQVLHLAQSPSCLLYTSPSPRDQRGSRMPSSA